MPKRMRSGEPVPIFGRHPASLPPAHLQLDLRISPPSGNGSRPNVVATVQPASAARRPALRAAGIDPRPQELSLTLRVRVVVGGHHATDLEEHGTLALTSACDVLEASWSDAGISQGLRKLALPTEGLPLRQRPNGTPVVDGEIEERRKRQKKLAPASGINTRLSPSPGTQPQRPAAETPAKPVATKAMGSGKSGVWTASVFKPTKTVLKLTGGLAPGQHASLPSSSRPSAASYANTLVVSVDGNGPKAGDSASGPGAGAISVGDSRNPPAGWAFAHKQGPEGIISGQLEQRGFDGEQHKASRSRAELRAVLAALEYRDWPNQDGVDRMVLVTASYHMTKGLTAWLREWKARQWHTGQNLPVQNRDLWQRANDVMGQYARAGCEISVCHVPRAKLGTKIAAAAKRAAHEQSPAGAESAVQYAAEGLSWTQAAHQAAHQPAF